MKILLINTLYYPFQIGGAEKSVKILAEELVVLGHDVSVLTLTNERRNKEILNGVSIYRLKIKNSYFPYSKKKHTVIAKIAWHLLDSINPFYSKKVSTILNEIKPDIVNANNLSGFSPFILRHISKQGIPVINTLRDYYLLCYKTTMYHKNCDAKRRCALCKLTSLVKTGLVNKYSLGAIGVSNFVLNKHYDLGLEKKNLDNIIYNTITPNKLEIRKDDKDICNIGYIGRISEEKGVLHLLSMLSSIKSTNIKWKLLLAGNGEVKFINKIKSEYDTSNIEFMGYVNSNDFYKKIDCLIVPSLWNEPFGRVALEGVNHGIPVLVNNVGGLSELATKINGISILTEKKLVESIAFRNEFDKEKTNEDLTFFSIDNHLNLWLKTARKAIEDNNKLSRKN